MSRPLMKIKTAVVNNRYGLLAAALLSTLALPQWSAAFSSTSAGGIILAQNQKEDPKDKGKQAPKSGPQFQKKGPTGQTGQPGQPKGAPSTQQGQQQQQQQQQQQGLPKQKSAEPQRKELPKQRSVEPQHKELPKSQTGQEQPKFQPKGFQPPPKNAFQQKGPPKGAVGNVEQLRSQRHERTEAGGRVVIEEPGRRAIVRESGHVFVRHDDAERFSHISGAHVERRGAEVYTVVGRPGGVEIVTVTDTDGRLIRRFRRGPDRREVVLIDNRPRAGAAGFFLGLAAPRITIPRDRYIVDVEHAPPALLYETLEAPPLMPVERAYSLDEIRYNAVLRDRMRRIDIDTIHFETGSWDVVPEQYPTLQEIAQAILRVVSANPSTVFMIEGYTDAVGQDVDNLSLSDRRAESVADILTSNFNVPPENLVTQGYGKQFLKIQTQEASRENRRVTVRNITPLLRGASR